MSANPAPPPPVHPETRARLTAFGKTTQRLRGLEIAIIAAEAAKLTVRLTAGPTSALASLFTMVAGVGQLVSLVYLMIWMNRGCALVPLLARRPRPYSQSAIILGFVIPVLSFFRPYQVMRTLDVSFDPNVLPAPAVRVETAGGGYREAAFALVPSRAIPAALVGAWWLFYLLAWFFRLFADNVALHPQRIGASTAAVVITLGALAVSASAATTLVVIGQIRARAEARLERLGAQTAG
jgi:hypothetical protein